MNILPKGIKLGFAAIVIGALAYLYTQLEAPSKNADSSKIQPETLIADPNHTRSPDNQVNHRPNPSRDPETRINFGLSEADWHEITLWEESRGYIPEEKTAEYKSYDVDTLSSLAISGDIAAIQLLAENFFVHGEREAALWAYYDAAARGSTYALLMAAQLKRIQHLELDRDSPEWKDKIIEAFALYDVGITLGDHEALTIASAIENAYDLSFTAQEQKEISQRSTGIYDELLQKRRDLNLGDFDKSFPDPVLRLHALITPRNTGTLKWKH